MERRTPSQLHAMQAARIQSDLNDLRRLRSVFTSDVFSAPTKRAYAEFIQALTNDLDYHKAQAALLRKTARDRRNATAPAFQQFDCQTCRDSGTTPRGKWCRYCDRGTAVKEQRLQADRALLNFDPANYAEDTRRGRPPSIQKVQNVPAAPPSD